MHQIDESIGDVFIFEETDTIFKNRINSSLYTNILFLDASNFFDGIQAHVKKYMSDFMKVHHSIKACAVFCGCFSNKVLEENKYFNSGYEAIFQNTDFDEWFSEKIKDRILTQIDDDVFKNGSNWTLIKVLFMQLHLIKYNSLRGESYVQLPDWIRRHALI